MFQQRMVENQSLFKPWPFVGELDRLMFNKSSTKVSTYPMESTLLSFCYYWNLSVDSTAYACLRLTQWGTILDTLASPSQSPGLEELPRVRLCTCNTVHLGKTLLDILRLIEEVISIGGKGWGKMVVWVLEYGLFWLMKVKPDIKTLIWI